MTGVQTEPGVAPSPSLWKRIVAPTGQPPAWGLVRYTYLLWPRDR